MGWVKLDDAFFTDEAVVIAGVEGRNLYIAGLCHASRNLTDGRIDKRALPGIAGIAGTEQSIASLLVEVGLWADEGSHYAIPNYLRFNPSRDKVLADRAAASARMQSRRSPEVPPNTGRSSDSPSRPVPDFSTSSSTSDPGPAPQPVDDDVPEAVWLEYARLKRAAAKEPIRSAPRYDARTIANGKAELGEKARRWWHRYDISPSELAQGLATDTPGRYWQERKPKDDT